MEALQKVNDALEQNRSSLSPSQLKKLRRKRGKLLQQVVHQQLNGGLQADEPAAKRMCLDSEEAAAEPSTSLQLSSHGPRASEPNTYQEVASQPQQQLAIHRQRQPAAAAGLSLQQLQDSIGKGSRQHAGGKHSLQPAVPTSSTSTGPCRTDLSGQLVVIQQELHSTGGDSNSTASQLLLQPPAQASSDCSFGTQPAQNPPAAHSNQAAKAVVTTAGGSQQQQQPQQSRKRSRPSCQYGNYHHYYGYRLKPSGFEDPRLKVLDPAWFAGADVLDVGCNEGLVTLALALHCGCHSVCGVDIDPVLVAKACTNLSRSRTQLNQQLHAAVRERNLLALKPRGLQIQQSQQQQQQQQQQHEAGPLGIIAASSMQSPAHRHSSSHGPSNHPAGTAPTAGQAAHGTGSQGHTIDGGAPDQPQPASGQQASASEHHQQQQQEHQQQEHQQLKRQQPPHAQLPQPQQSQIQDDRQNHHQQQQQQLGPKARIMSVQRQIKALSRVSFRAGNWLDLPFPSNKYEVITCFSVTKWIQLNWGDDGIMRLFHKFYRCLAPGGLLVLEPQPSKSYKNAIHKPGVQAAPYVDLEQLKLRPEQFGEFLTERVGFELVQQLGAVSEAAGADAVSVKGFDRPILVLRKPAIGAAGLAARAAGAVGGEQFEG